MLDDDVVALVLERHVELLEEVVTGLAHDHRAHELAADPRAAAGSDAGLDDGDLEVGTLLGEDVGGRQAGRASADCAAGVSGVLKTKARDQDALMTMSEMAVLNRSSPWRLVMAAISRSSV